MKKTNKEVAKTSITILLIVAGLVVMVCCIGFIYFNNSIADVVSSFAENNMLTSIETKTQIMDEYIKDAETMLKTFSEGRELKELLEDPDNPTLRASAQDYTMRFYHSLTNWEGLYLDTWDAKVITHTNPEKIDLVMREGEKLKQLQDAIYEDRDWVHNGGVFVAPVTNTLVVPMYGAVYNDQGEIIGFVGGALETEKLNDLLNKSKIEGLEHAEYSLIDVTSGLYIYNQNKKLINTVADSEMASDIMKQIDKGVYIGTSRYTDDQGTEYVSVYKYMPERQWVFIIKDTAKEIYSSAYKINSFRVIIIFQYILVISVVILLVIIVIRGIRTEVMLETVNNRYLTASSQASSIVFEYDYNTDSVEVNGSCEQIFGISNSKADLTFHDDFLPRIHKEDLFIVDEMRALKENTNKKLNSELRFREYDGYYRWYRLSAQAIENKNSEIRIIGNFINADEQIIMTHQLKKEAETDLLTGLINKVTMENDINDYLKNMSAEDVAALYMIDLDNFKAVNDILGHQMGDRAICEAADNLNLIFTENDYIARLGGDEFAVFICIKGRGRDFSRKLIEDKAERIRRKMHMTYFNGHAEVRVTSSIGITLYRDGDTFQKLYERADQALYQAKTEGKDRYAYIDG